MIFTGYCVYNGFTKTVQRAFSRKRKEDEKTRRKDFVV